MRGAGSGYEAGIPCCTVGADLQLQLMLVPRSTGMKRHISDIWKIFPQVALIQATIRSCPRNGDERVEQSAERSGANDNGCNSSVDRPEVLRGCASKQQQRATCNVNGRDSATW